MALINDDFIFLKIQDQVYKLTNVLNDFHQYALDEFDKLGEKIAQIDTEEIKKELENFKKEEKEDYNRNLQLIQSLENSTNEKFKTKDEEIASLTAQIDAISIDLGTFKNTTNNKFAQLQNYIDEELAKKQDKLIAGNNIKIENNVISSSAEGTALDSASIIDYNYAYYSIIDEAKKNIKLYIDDYALTSLLQLKKVDGKIVLSAPYDTIYKKSEVNNLLSNKQDKLTAGDNIKIENNVISSSAGGSGLETALLMDINGAKYNILDDDKKNILLGIDNGGTNPIFKFKKIANTIYLQATLDDNSIELTKIKNIYKTSDGGEFPESDDKIASAASIVAKLTQYGYSKTEIDNQINNLQNLIDEKQKILTAGDGIKIDNNTISANPKGKLIASGKTEMANYFEARNGRVNITNGYIYQNGSVINVKLFFTFNTSAKSSYDDELWFIINLKDNMKNLIETTSVIDFGGNIDNQSSSGTHWGMVNCNGSSFSMGLNKSYTVSTSDIFTLRIALMAKLS